MRVTRLARVAMAPVLLGACALTTSLDGLSGGSNAGDADDAQGTTDGRDADGSSTGEGGSTTGDGASSETETGAPLTITPASGTLFPGADLSFDAGQPGVTWTVSEPGGGSVDATGHYRAPFAAGTFHVVASASGRASATATVTVTPGVALLAGQIDGFLDGTGPKARFRIPDGLAFDAAGNLYVSDTKNAAVRKVTAEGVVTTLAGDGTPGTADGPGKTARFLSPQGIAVDKAGNVYVADFDDHTIRKIDPSGVVSVFAGRHGTPGTADGSADVARLRGPTALAFTSTGALLVADYGNHTIRSVTADGTVSTIAGSGGDPGSVDGDALSTARFKGPCGIALDAAGDLYVADEGNYSLRKVSGGVVSTLAGKLGERGYEDATGEAARFTEICGVTVGSGGDVFVTDPYNYAVRRVTSGGVVSTFAGGAYGGTNGAAARFVDPGRIVTGPGGDLFLSEWSAHDIRRVTPAGVVSTFVGPSIYGGQDGPGAGASFHDIDGLALDKEGNVLVADLGCIRKISPSGDVSTLAGTDTFEWAYADGAGGAARFAGLRNPALDGSGNLIVADHGSGTIRKVTPQGAVSTIAGAAWEHAMIDGPIANARFDHPNGVAVDANGTILVADGNNGRVRAISPQGGVSTKASGMQRPSGIVVEPGGAILVADWQASVVWRIAPKLSVAFGVENDPGHADGKAARLDDPWALALDPAGGAVLGEYDGSTVRRLRGEVTTVAGTARSRATLVGALPGSVDRVTGIAVGPTSIIISSRAAVFHVVLPK